MKIKTFTEYSQELVINEIGDLKNIISYDFKLIRNSGNRATYKFDLIEEDGSTDIYTVTLEAIWYQENIVSRYSRAVAGLDFYENLQKKFNSLDSLFDISFKSERLGYSLTKDSKGMEYIFKILKTVVDILENYTHNSKTSGKVGFCFTGDSGDSRRLNIYKSI